MITPHSRFLRTRPIAGLAAISAIALALALPAAAQAQAPQIAGVWPPGGMRGTHVAAEIEGSGMAAATQVLVSGRGVRATPGTPAKGGGSTPVALDIAPDAGPGPYELRVLGPKGASNPGYVWVGAFPETPEKEPNDHPEQAMTLDKLPITVDGRMNAAEDVDWYRFHASAGDTYAIDIVTNRLYAPMDAFLELRDSEDHLLGEATVGYDRDPRLIHTFKATGDYLLQVHDTQFRGGPGFVYKLTVGKVPAITSLYVTSSRRGETFSAEVQGVNLGGMTTLSGRVPADAPDGRTWWLTPETPNGPGLAVAVAADGNVQVDGRALLAQSAAGPFREPTTIHGMLAATGPSTGRKADRYALRFDPGQPVRVAVKARSIGSRMLPYVRILEPAGKEVLNTEDQIGGDPTVTFTPAYPGAYRIEVSSVDAQGGPGYVYDLVLLPTGHPDFVVTASPDRLMPARGQSVVMSVSIDRRGGFAAPVRCAVEGLPTGVSASQLTLAPDQTSGIITLTAAQNAAPAASEIRVTATPAAGGTPPAARIADTMASLPRPGEGEDAPRHVAYQFASVSESVPLYTLSVEPAAPVDLAPGQTATIKVRAARKPGDNNANPAIALTLADLPPGVTGETLAIPEKQSEVTIKLTASPGARAGSRSALLTGKLGDTVEAAPAIVVTIRPR